MNFTHIKSQTFQAPVFTATSFQFSILHFEYNCTDVSYSMSSQAGNEKIPSR